MIRHPGKLKKKRFDELKAQIVGRRRLDLIGSLLDDELDDFEEDDEYEADDEEFEDLEEELVTELGF